MTESTHNSHVHSFDYATAAALIDMVFVNGVKRERERAEKMDSNGNKVQTLRQQFEGLRKSENGLPNISQKSKKPSTVTTTQLAKGSSNGLNNAKNGNGPAELSYKMLNTSFNANNTRADGAGAGVVVPSTNSHAHALLKTGNRAGFIAPSILPTSLRQDKSSSSSTSTSTSGSEQHGNGQQDAESTSSSDVTIELNCKLDPLSSPSLRNIRRKRNGIYVSDATVAAAVTLGAGEDFVLHGEQDVNSSDGSGSGSGSGSSDNSLDIDDEEAESNGGNLRRPTSAGDLDTDDSSGNSQSNSNRSSLHSSVNVKRSNAFRQRDIDSPEPRFGRGSKIVLDRVKSLELPRNPNATTVSRKTCTDEPKRAAAIVISSHLSGVSQPRPKSLASMASTKAVNVVTPYQVSDIYPPDASLRDSKTRGSGKQFIDMEAPEYAVPIPVLNRCKGNNSKPPEPPKYPPPPPAYKNPRQGQSQIPPITTRGALTSFQQQQPLKVERSLPPQRKDNHVNQNVSVGRGPPPEKPPRTFLYDILSDENQRLRFRATQTQKNSLTLLPQRSPALSSGGGGASHPSTPERKSATLKMSGSASGSSIPSATSLAGERDTFYKRSPSDKSLAKPKVAISTAKIRQTTPNSGHSQRAQDGKLVPQQQQQQQQQSPSGLPLTPSTNHSQMLVRSKTESQITLRGSKGRSLLHAESPLSHLGSPANASASTHRSLGRNAQLNFQSQLYLNQHSNQLERGYDYESRTQELHNLMSNTNLLQQLRPRGNYDGRNTTPLRSESNLVFSAKEAARLDSSFHLHQPNNGAVSIHAHKLGLPPSPHYTAKEYRISRQHSNSLLFMNNLIRLSSYNAAAGLGFGDGEYGGRAAALAQDNRSNQRGGLGLGLTEKSKSEWTLNRIGVGIGIGGYNGAGSGSGISGGGSGSINVAVHNEARRSTIPTAPIHSLTLSAASIASSPLGGSGSTPTTGHGHASSLESGTGTLAAHSSGKLLRPGIQQSIQNLVNQLFSPSASASSSSPVIGTTTKEATSSTDSGIQLGSESLSSCDTPVGDSTTDTGDSDCENDVETSNNARQVVEARKGYIRRVSSIRVQEIPSIHRLFLQTSRRPNSGESLFECLLIVGLNRDPYTGVYHPYIRDKFPPNAKVAAGVEQFCFPDSLEWPCHEGPTAQSYTLAITDHRGSRKYGCCYRILPEGANICIPITYVIISARRAIGFYREVLRELAQRHGYAEYQKKYIMEDLYKKSFPAPMEDITVTDPFQDDMYLPFGQQQHQSFNIAEEASLGHGLSPSSNYNNFILPSPRTIVIRRKADPRLEEGDLVTLLTALDLSVLLKLFGSLLLERKVVLISRSLCTVSLCVEALESMLYPFTWQHTFVPILPLTMTDVLDAPAPFLIGCLRSLQTPWDKTLDEGIVIDLDQNKVLSCVGDEGNILPKRIYRKLRTALQFVVNMSDQKEHTKNVLTSECFIRMFVETLGHYSSHIIGQKDGVKIFDRESFIRASDTKATQNFLEWFSETSMFHEFIELRLKGNPPPGLFEQRILEQSELNASTNGVHVQTQTTGTPLTFKNAKFFMKGSKPFGNWLKDAFVK